MISDVYLRVNNVVTLCFGSGDNSRVAVACVHDAYASCKVEERLATGCLDVGSLAGGED